MFELVRENNTKPYIIYNPNYMRFGLTPSANDAENDVVEVRILPTMHSVCEKFDDIFKLVNDMFEYDTELHRLYEYFILDYASAEEDDRLPVFFQHAAILLDKIDEVFSEMQLGDNLNVKEANYKLNITRAEALALYRLSVRLRFFIPVYLSQMSIKPMESKIVHNMLGQEVIELGIVRKIFNIIKSSVMTTNPDREGKKLWDILAATKGITPDNQILEMFNMMYYNALISMRPEENPIAYLIMTAKNPLVWNTTEALSNIYLPSTIDALTMIHPKSNLLQSEIFYRVIVQKMFSQIAEEYKDYSKLYHYNIYCTLTSISQPIIQSIFNLPIRALNVPNVHVINFFTHKFLLRAETHTESISLLTDLLLAIPMPIVERRELESLPEDMIRNLGDLISSHSITRRVPFLTHNTIKKFFVSTVLTFYKHQFLDVFTGEPIDINWDKLMKQLVYYVYQITSKNYEREMEEVRRQIREI